MTIIAGYTKLFILIATLAIAWQQPTLAMQPKTMSQLLKESPNLSFKSKEGDVVVIPVKHLSKECKARLKRLDLLAIENNAVKTNFSKNILSIVKATLGKSKSQLKFEGNSFPQAQQLCDAFVFFNIDQTVLGKITKSLEEAFTCDPKKLVYPWKDFYNDLLEENIKSVIDTPPDIPNSGGNPSFFKQDFYSKIYLSTIARRQAAFQVVSHYAQTSPNVKPDYVVDKESWQDLEVFCGPQSSPSSSFAAAIDCASSELGRVLLYSHLLQQTSDMQKIKLKQEIIAALMNDDLFQQLNNLHSTFFGDQRNENNILSLYSGVDNLNCYAKYPEFSNKHLKQIALWLESNEWNRQIEEGTQLFIFMAVDKILGCLDATTKYALGDVRNNLLYKDMATLIPRVVQRIIEVVEYGKDESFAQAIRSSVIAMLIANLTVLPAVGALPAAAIAFVAGYMADKVLQVILVLAESMIHGADYVKAMADLQFCMHERLVMTVNYIDFMKKVSDTIDAQQPQLKELLPSLKNLDLHAEPQSVLGYFAQEVYGPATFGQFMDKLNSLGRNTWLRSFAGRVVGTYGLLERHKECLLASFMALAELDMYLSLARFFKKNQEAQRPICFTDFLEQDTPSLELVDLWSPTIKGDAVPNSITLGTNDKPRNAIITGSNAGGKSTFMRGIGFTPFLGAFGIATAKKASYTPFSSVRIYTNMTDDAANGLSLFAKSATRVGQLVKEAKGGWGFTLTLFDEPFTGTSPNGAEALINSTLLELCGTDACANNICIASTHFPCVQTLAANPKMNCTFFRAVDPSDEKPFRVVPGIHSGVNAFDIAEKMDMDQAILDGAKEYYDAHFVQDQKLHMFLDLLGNNASCLNENFVKKHHLCFARLVLIAPYNESFFEIAQNHNLNLSGLLNITDEQGRTVLHFAGLWDIKDSATVKKLIKEYQAQSMQDSFGKTPLDYVDAQSCLYELMSEQFANLAL